MKYFLVLFVFFAAASNASESFDSKKEALKSLCIYQDKTYSPGFVLILQNGEQTLRCSVVMLSEKKFQLAWVEINGKGLASDPLIIKE